MNDPTDKLTPQEKAEYIQDKVEFTAQEDARQFLQAIDQTKPNAMIPTPPKPGEIMYCRVCGKPMLPKDFDPNPIVRRREFKWQIHKKCDDQMQNMVDRQVPGLLAERKKRFGG